ncbi:MAG: hypothetical protein AAGD25_40630, partial [Cyanobacteria bacterium P01_F01_bin.150]
TFQQRLRPLSAHIPTSAQKQWQIAEAQIQTIHQMCQRIARQESLFLADVIETLHTVLALAKQLAHACEVTNRVQTPQYQARAQQQLTNSQTRLKQTCDQLQKLHDQLAVVGLEQAQSSAPDIADRLQFIVAANENVIESS